MMYYSLGLGYRANESLRAEYGPVLFQTSLSLAERFNKNVGCTESWGPGKHCNARSAHKDTECEFTVIIDNMMNLEILLFAALSISDVYCGGCTPAQRTHLLLVAETHATTAAHNHIRPDGSIAHIVCYDPTTGQERFTCNGGGVVDNTTWARGQAWAVYGFTMVYRYTRNATHLATATKLADFFVGRLSSVRAYSYCPDICWGLAVVVRGITVCHYTARPVRVHWKHPSNLDVHSYTRR